ncbi:MAG TPA: methyltransferase dimerization domain-containing protein [Verrucomicrobiae bacterium]|nr:methyltransferase dimerization domain-containing protein [Verrucomicrobiae bacterium]
MSTHVTPERIMQFAWGYAPPLIIRSALQLRVFDLLDASPRTIDEVARATGASRRGLTAILNALVGLQLLTRTNAHYSLTPDSAAFLVSTRPGYHGRFFDHTIDQILPKWLKLDEVVRTGKPAAAVNDQAQGAEFFAGFVESLFPMAYPAARALGEHLGLANARTPVRVLDLAAGSGVWGIALAQQSTQVRVSAVDWPIVLETTKRVAARHGVGDRLETIAGDLLQVDFGTGHNIAVLGQILHSEGEKRSRQLIKKTFEALAPGGTIAVAEFTPNEERTGPPNALLFAVNMLVNTDEGDTFTFKEVSDWLIEAGFRNPRQLEAPGPSPLILATKP